MSSAQIVPNEAQIAAARQYFEVQEHKDVLAALLGQDILKQNNLTAIPRGKERSFYDGLYDSTYITLNNAELVVAARNRVEEQLQKEVAERAAAFKSEKPSPVADMSSDVPPAKKGPAFSPAKPIEVRHAYLGKGGLAAATLVAMVLVPKAAGAQQISASAQFGRQNAMVNNIADNACSPQALTHNGMKRAAAGTVVGALGGLISGRASNVWKGALAGTGAGIAQNARDDEWMNQQCRQADVNLRNNELWFEQQQQQQIQAAITRFTLTATVENATKVAEVCSQADVQRTILIQQENDIRAQKGLSTAGASPLSAELSARCEAFMDGKTGATPEGVPIVTRGNNGVPQQTQQQQQAQPQGTSQVIHGDNGQDYVMVGGKAIPIASSQNASTAPDQTAPTSQASTTYAKVNYRTR